MVISLKPFYPGIATSNNIIETEKRTPWQELSFIAAVTQVKPIPHDRAVSRHGCYHHDAARTTRTRQKRRRSATVFNFHVVRTNVGVGLYALVSKEFAEMVVM
ncbi:hypothetical protein TNCV_2218321 [Trichonephila clavipes]|nr:hypothetical protein TNCV_2218321 [Trichonephila clavipes]